MENARILHALEVGVLSESDVFVSQRSDSELGEGSPLWGSSDEPLAPVVAFVGSLTKADI